MQVQTGMHRLADLKETFSREIIHYFIEQAALQIVEKEVSRSEAYFENISATSALVLNEEQEAAVQAITQQIGHDGKPFLLEGVTGSGKTEVYLQVIQEALSRGKTAIMLVPEISLTPQVTNRFISRFGKKVAILHSGLSNGERYDEWRKVERGAAQVVVGARSAIFAPLKILVQLSLMRNMKRVTSKTPTHAIMREMSLYYVQSTIKPFWCWGRRRRV